MARAEPAAPESRRDERQCRRKLGVVTDTGRCSGRLAAAFGFDGAPLAGDNILELAELVFGLSQVSPRAPQLGFGLVESFTHGCLVVDDFVGLGVHEPLHVCQHLLLAVGKHPNA